MTVKKKVKETERSIWEAGMQTESALEMYRLFKTDIDKESLIIQGGAPYYLKPERGFYGLGNIKPDIRE